MKFAMLTKYSMCDLKFNIVIIIAVNFTFYYIKIRYNLMNIVVGRLQSRTMDQSINVILSRGQVVPRSGTLE